MATDALDLSFRVEPPKVRLIIPPAGSQAGVIKAYNQSPDSIKIKAYVEDWAYSMPDGTKDFFSAKTTPLSCADWISFNPAEFTIPPYGVVDVNFIARVPADAEGGHYAVMFFETTYLKPDEEAGQTEELRAGAYLNVRLGSLIYIEAKDKVKRLAELSNFSLSKDAKNKYFFIGLDFKNIGNVDITAGGTFDIIDKQGMVLARGEFNNVYTFPGDTAKLSATWKGAIPQGRYDLVLTLDLGKALEELGLGRGPVITKEAEIEIGADGEVLSAGGLK